MRLVRRRARAPVAAAALLVAGCGGGDGAGATSEGPLDWKTTPVLTVADRLPDDRILAGTVRNASLREEVTLDSARVVVRDAAGVRLQAYALYSFAYAHGLYGVAEAPNGPVDSDKERLGYRRKLKPGQTSPLVVAYRLTKAARPPITVDYGGGRLPVPGASGGGRE